MEKIITIDGRQVKFKSTGAFLLRYKEQFHRDAIKDIYKMQDAIEEVEEIVVNEQGEEEKITKNEVKNIDALDLDVFFNLIWTLAKTADKEIQPPMEWLDTFGEFPLMEIIPDIIDLVFSCISSSVESKKKQEIQTKQKKNILRLQRKR